VTREDIHKLIGGYATGSLSQAERAALFEAALDDQDLFDELGREQALKELLDEPGAKQRLIAGLSPRQQGAWLRRPWPWLSIAGALAFAAVIVSVLLVRHPEVKETQEIAQAQIPKATRTFREPAPAQPVAPKLAAPPVLETSPLEPPAELKKVAPALPAQDAVPVAKDSEPVKAAAAGSVRMSPVAPAAAPAPGPNAATGATGGFGGGGAARPRAAQLQQGNAGLAKTAAPAGFAFTYSVTPEGMLRIQPAADGFLTVIFNDGQALLSGQATRAGATIDVPVPAGSTKATILYAAQNISTATTTGSLAAEDPPSGTKIDPAPSPNSRLQAVIALPPRE
jgi:hypothetical protein